MPFPLSLRQYSGKHCSFHFHGALRAELLTAKAPYAAFSINHRQFIFHRNCPCRTNSCTFRTADTFFCGNLWSGGKHTLSHLAEKLSGKAATRCTAEIQIISRINLFKIGNIKITRNTKYLQLFPILRYKTALLCRNRDSLTEGLTEAQKELLEKYDDCQSELSAKTEKNAFVQGFCLGMRLLAAATYTQTGE